MSEKGSKKRGSLLRAAKPEVVSKAVFVGKWNAGQEISENLLTAIRDNITADGGIRTKLRMFDNGLRVGEKSSLFAFPEQFYPIEAIKSIKRDETYTNTIIVITETQKPPHIFEISVYRCQNEYDARQFVECYDKHKVRVDADADNVNWSLRVNGTGKKLPRAVIATAMNGHDDNVTKVSADQNTKTIHIQTSEPIYATVKKQQKPQSSAELEKRVSELEIENQRLRDFINQRLVTTYQAVPVKQTDIPVDRMLLLEGNRLKPVTDEASLYGGTRSAETVSLNNSGQFARGSLQYQRRPASTNGYPQREVETRVLVPAETLRRNLRHHTYVERKIDHVYRAPPSREPVRVIQPEYQEVAESLPPRDSVSSLESEIEEHDTNGEVFEIHTPTPVRYM